MHCIQRGIYLDADVKDFRCFDEILDWDFFSSKHFIKEDGSLYTDIINPGIMATIATKYGFVYDDVEQKLQGNMKIYNSSVFAGDLSTLNSKNVE